MVGLGVEACGVFSSPKQNKQNKTEKSNEEQIVFDYRAINLSVQCLNCRGTNFLTAWCCCVKMDWSQTPRFETP